MLGAFSCERRCAVLRSHLVACSLLAAACASTSKPAPSLAGEAALAGRAGAPTRKEFLSPAEVLKRLEDSKILYRLEPRDSPPGGWAEALWPTHVEPVTAPRVVVEDGRRIIREWPENAKAEALIEQGEVHYRERRYLEAAKLYQQAVDVCPDCYLARAYLGDALLFAGDAEAALGHYREAAELNPDDYRLYYFQGSALARLGRLPEAREAFAMSLVLNPRNPLMRQFFRQNRGLGMGMLEDVLVPRGFARREGEEIIVEFDPDYGAAWLAYANCKALWLGEASHREEMTGTAEPHFSSVEEMECLWSVANVHAAQRAEGSEDRVDSSLDGLMSVIQDGMTLELVLFEMAARVHPQYTLTLEEEERKRLKDYVLRYVLIPMYRM